MVSFKQISSPALVLMGSLSSSVSALSNLIGQGFARKGPANGGSHAIQRIFDDLSSIVDIGASVKDPAHCPQIGLCMEGKSTMSISTSIKKICLNIYLSFDDTM
jgi:hypothetical protein